MRQKHSDAVGLGWTASVCCFTDSQSEFNSRLTHHYCDKMSLQTFWTASSPSPVCLVLCHLTLMLSGPPELPTPPQTGWLIKTRPVQLPEQPREKRRSTTGTWKDLERDKERNLSTNKQLTHEAASTSWEKTLVWEPLSLSIKERLIQRTSGTKRETKRGEKIVMT